MNKADKAAMVLFFIVGPALWMFGHDWRGMALACLVALTIGVCWGSAGSKDKKRNVADGPAKEECAVHCAGGCTYPNCLPGHYDQEKPAPEGPPQPPQV